MMTAPYVNMEQFQEPIAPMVDGFVVQPLEAVKVDEKLPHPLVVRFPATDFVADFNVTALAALKFVLTLVNKSTGETCEGLSTAKPTLWGWNKARLTREVRKTYDSPKCCFILIDEVKFHCSGYFFIRVDVKWLDKRGLLRDCKVYDSLPIYVSIPQQCVGAGLSKFITLRIYPC